MKIGSCHTLLIRIAVVSLLLSASTLQAQDEGWDWGLAFYL